MPQRKTKKKKMTKQQKVATGIGIGVALAAAAAAIYAFSGEKGKERRKKVALWTREMKKEAIDALKNSKDMSKKTYHDIVDDLEAKYRLIKNVNKTELALLAAQMKKHWDHIHTAVKEAQREVKKASTTTKRRAKAAARKTKRAAKK